MKATTAHEVARPLLPAAVLLAAVLLAVALPAVAQEEGGKDDPLLATVNGRELRLSDLHRSVASLPLGDQIEVRDQMKRYRESLITEEVLFQWVLTEGMERDKELREEIKALVVEQLIRKLVRERIVVTGAEVSRFHQENRALVRGTHVRVRQIALGTRPACEQTMARIGSEEDFIRLARELSRDPRTAKEGGDVGFIMPLPGPLGYETEVFGMSLGEMRIFESQEGCRLVRVVEISQPPEPTPRRVEAYVRPILERRREQELLKELIEKARGKVKVETMPLPPSIKPIK